MSTDTSFAVKYRPKDFSEVVGQEGTINTILGMLGRGDKINHAMILYGPRGTGKTTNARILAKYINCAKLKKLKNGGVRTCDTCESCKLADEDRHPDIVEINVGDQRGIDDARGLVQQARNLPIYKYRVFILDECFVPGTSVRTSGGNKPIEEVLPGELALTHKGRWRTVVRRIRNTVPLTRMARVELDNGVVIFTTIDHVFFTTDGELPVSRITGRKVLLASGEGSNHTGQEEGRVPAIARVDSVKIYKPGHNDEDFASVVSHSEREAGVKALYDLEIEEDHSYCANGVFVHNCHRYTPDAAQRLLKPIEEPSSHVVFILCTTTPHALPVAIRSRLLKLEVTPADPEKLADRLAFICESEGQKKLAKKREALLEIVKAADNHPRDAISLLERVVYQLEAHPKSKPDIQSLLPKMTEDSFEMSADVLAQKLLNSILRHKVGAAIRFSRSVTDVPAFCKVVLDMMLNLLLACEAPKESEPRYVEFYRENVREGLAVGPLDGKKQLYVYPSTLNAVYGYFQELAERAANTYAGTGHLLNHTVFKCLNLIEQEAEEE